MSQSVATWDNLARACQSFVGSWAKVDRMQRRKNPDEDKFSRAMGQHILNLYALREAIELTSGEWDDKDVEVALAMTGGEVNIIELMRGEQEQKKLAEMLDGATVHDEEGNLLDLESGTHNFTITQAWHDESGQLHVCVKETNGE